MDLQSSTAPTLLIHIQEVHKQQCCQLSTLDLRELSQHGMQGQEIQVAFSERPDDLPQQAHHCVLQASRRYQIRPSVAQTCTSLYRSSTTGSDFHKGVYQHQGQAMRNAKSSSSMCLVGLSARLPELLRTCDIIN